MNLLTLETTQFSCANGDMMLIAEKLFSDGYAVEINNMDFQIDIDSGEFEIMKKEGVYKIIVDMLEYEIEDILEMIKNPGIKYDLKID